MRVSSKLTLFSKIMILVFGIPVSCVIAYESQYALWSIGVSLLMIALCLFFAVKTADLYKENETLVFQKPMTGRVSVNKHEIKKVKLFRSSKHTYLWFNTLKGSFLVIAPMWGDEREALLKIHSEYSTALSASA